MSSPEMTYSTCMSRSDNQNGYFDNIARTDIVCSLLNSVGDFGVQTIGRVHDGSSFLEHTKGLDERWRETLGGTSNIEILQRPEVRIKLSPS